MKTPLERKIKRAQRLAKPKPMLEDEIHQRVVADLRAAGWDGCFFHAANEGKVPVQYRAKLKRLGVSPGVPDLVIVASPPRYDAYVAPGPCVPPPPGAVIEIKRIGGRLSKPQKEWLNRFRCAGFLTRVCYGLDACRETLKEWGYL